MAGNTSRLHHMEVYKRADGKYAWRITVGKGDNADIVVTDGGQGYEHKIDCLAGLFGNFFGEWDESFLELYADWQKVGGTYDVPPEAQEGVPVLIREETPHRDADAPNYSADDDDESDAPELDTHDDESADEQPAT